VKTQSKYYWILAFVVVVAIVGIVNWRTKPPEILGLRLGMSKDTVIKKFSKYSIARDPTQPIGTAYVRPLFRSRYGVYSGPIFLSYYKDKLAQISLELSVRRAFLIKDADARRAKELTYERYEELLEGLIEKHGEPSEETFGQEGEFFARWETKNMAIHIALDRKLPHIIRLSYTHKALWEKRGAEV
jgi:hypothetical protein